MKRALVLSVLYFSCMGFALAVPHVVHQSRQLVHELQQLRQEQLLLDQEWGQLLLEQSTWGAYSRIENEAFGSLQMRRPQFTSKLSAIKGRR